MTAAASMDPRDRAARGAVEVRIKRIYDPPASSDGVRVLVDRLWPRGLTQHEAQVDLWLKSVAPSADLRRWFGHDPARWPGFEERYRAELASNPALKDLLALVEQYKQVTLLFAARDTERNNAAVLQTLCRPG